jgi:hypothetical protein
MLKTLRPETREPVRDSHCDIARKNKAVNGKAQRGDGQTARRLIKKK